MMTIIDVAASPRTIPLMRILILIALSLLIVGCEKTIHEARTPVASPLASAR